MGLRVNMETPSQQHAAEALELPRLQLEEHWCPTHGGYCVASGEDPLCPTCGDTLAESVAKRMDADWKALVDSQRIEDHTPASFPLTTWLLLIGALACGLVAIYLYFNG